MIRTYVSYFVAAAILFVAILSATAWLLMAQNDLRAAIGPPFPLTGYAWANTDALGTNPPESGVGWISMNCSNDNTCASSNYHVQVDNNTNKNLSGYAWSEHIGWIHFGANGCPAADTDGLNCQPHVISDGGTGWEMTGWARALAYSDPQAGGWDGWISLNCLNTGTCNSGANPSDYAIRISSTGVVASAKNQTGSFAWGGDIVTGWVDFGAVAGISGSGVVITDICSASRTYTCTDVDSLPGNENSHESGTDAWCSPITSDRVCTGLEICEPTSTRCRAVTVPTLNVFTVLPQIIRSGGTVSVSWNSVVPVGSTCTVAGAGINQTSSAAGQFNGNNVVSSPISNQTSITFTCDGTIMDTKTIRVIPSVYES